MAANVGKRYIAPSGAEVIITKGGPGTLSDGEVPLVLKDGAPPGGNGAAAREGPAIELGKRYRSADGDVELLVIKAGVCDLRYNGDTMEVLQPKILPSAD
jgi:hypothetical protein